jgi:hypothetical protein
MSPNKYNEQIDLAGKVRALLCQVDGRKWFISQLNLFRDWETQWSQKNEECLRKRGKLTRLDFKHADEIEKINEKINELWNNCRRKYQRRKNQLDEERMAAKLSAALEPLQEDRKKLSRKRRQYRRQLARLKPSEDSPWGRLTVIPIYSKDEYVTDLMKYLCPVEPMEPIDPSPAVCLRYVRLSILHDRALKDDGALQPLTASILPIEPIVDPEHKELYKRFLYGIESAWQEMCDKWESWRVVLNDDLEVVKANLREEPAELKPPGVSGEPNKAHINLSDWKKSDSRNLMHDLLDDELREGVRIRSKRHGKQQPTKVRRVLKGKGFQAVAKTIIRVKDKERKYKLDIPFTQITFDPPKT